MSVSAVLEYIKSAREQKPLTGLFAYLDIHRHLYLSVSATVFQIHFVAPDLATEPIKTKSYNLLIFIDYTSVATALDGYASKGSSQRKPAVERATAGTCRVGTEMARYA